MRRSKPSTEPDDAGSASLEFIVAGLVLLVPIVYLVVALGIIQSHALGAQSTARHIARAVATAPDVAAAEARIETLRVAIAGEYGIDAESVDVELSCMTEGPCPAAGETIVVRVSAEAALPLVPPVLGLDDLTRVPVEAQSVQRMSRLWGVS